MTDFLKDSSHLFGLTLNTTLYNYHHIYLFISFCNLALTRLYTYIELYYITLKKSTHEHININYPHQTHWHVIHGSTPRIESHVSTSSTLARHSHQHATHTSTTPTSPLLARIARHSSNSDTNQDFSNTAQKIKFSIKDFFSKCNQMHSFLRIWSHLLKKFRVENFIFSCSVNQELSKMCMMVKNNMIKI